MGQRSQIYLRYNGKLLFANYYQWNYAERMISRARWGIEYIKDYIDSGFDFAFRDDSYIEKISRVFDANFDMHDVQISRDIVNEWESDYSEVDFNRYVFNMQDNNDGQLYIDILGGEIFYCFRDWTNHEDGITSDMLMSAIEYMDWDYEGWENNLNAEGNAVCRANIKAIDEMAQLMTLEQLDDFLHGDYEPKPF